MLLSTTDTLDGHPIHTYLGIVTAEVVYGSNALRDFFAGIRDIIGGRTGSYERVFQQSQAEAMKELQQRARQLGANAVVGIRLSAGSIEIGDGGVLLLVTASGTAVKI